MMRGLVASCLLVGVVSCARTLPDQDRRIVTAAPDAKLSADVLWKDFQAGIPAAVRRYHGRAVVVSGVVTRVDQHAESAVVFFAQAGDHGIVANLLDDEAAAIVKGTAAGERLTLKCYCEGFAADIILKSCVKP